MRSAMIMVCVVVTGCGGPASQDAGAADGGDAGLDAAGPVCDGGLDAGPIARGLSRVCSGGVVGSGFSIRYATEQPIARLGAFIRPEAPDGCGAGAALSRASLITDFDSRLDEGVTLATYHVLGEPPPAPPDAGTTWVGARMTRGSVAIDIDSAVGSTVTVPVLFDLGLAGLDAAPEITVILDGMEIDTDVPQATGYPADHDARDGYLLRGLGAAVGAATRSGVDLRFEATATLAFAQSRDSAMGRAASVARARMIIHYTVVGLPETPPTGRVSYRSSCRPDEAATALSIEGSAGARAAPALTAFGFDVWPGSMEGTTIREVTVLVDGFTHDPSTGRATMSVLGFLEGPDDAPLETEFDAEVVLLGWTGGEGVESLRYGSTVDSGRTETSLPLSR